jgi:hypothetical protein
MIHRTCSRTLRWPPRNLLLLWIGGLILIGTTWVWLGWARGRVIAQAKSVGFAYRVREIPLDRFPLNMLVSEASYCYTCEVLRGHVVLTSCSFSWDSYRPTAVVIELNPPGEAVFIFDKTAITAKFSTWHGATWTEG